MAKETPIGDPLVRSGIIDATGVGIPLDKQETIFEAFTQSDRSMTRRYGGTGLGLAISTRLVNLMGGRIWVESDIGRGSTFHFTVRFRMQKISSRKYKPVGAEMLQGLPLLIVDDNATNRRILQETVFGWQMKPTPTESGPKALTLLERANIRKPIKQSDPLQAIKLVLGSQAVTGENPRSLRSTRCVRAENG